MTSTLLALPFLLLLTATNGFRPGPPTQPCDAWGCTCQGFSDKYATHAHLTWGTAQQQSNWVTLWKWWGEKRCTTAPDCGRWGCSCQGLSNTFGIRAGHGWGHAQEDAQWMTIHKFWSDHSCATWPQVAGDYCTATLYQHDNFEGSERTYGVGFRASIWMNDAVSSIHVKGGPGCTVYVYEDRWYKGWQRILIPGWYKKSDLKNLGVGNDKISSIKVFNDLGNVGRRRISGDDQTGAEADPSSLAAPPKF